MTSPRVLFAGTPDFARASLDALLAAGIEPVAVFTQPDRPAGRGRKLAQSPVKLRALERDIEVQQPATLKTDAALATIASYDADVMIVAAYGLILPQAVLDLPKQGCLNVHASLLPRWRGAAPIQHAILAGDAQTGISLMAMEAGLDSGPVFATAAIDIAAQENAGELHDRLAQLGGELLVAELDAILSGQRAAEPQDESLVTYAGKITSDDARLDWSRDAAELARAVRAFNPVPGAWCRLGDERIKCWQARAVDGAGAPGQVLQAQGDELVVACGGAALRLERLQRPGKKPVSAAEFNAQLNLADRRFD